MALDDWDKGNRRKKLIIYTDNQAAIRTVGNPTGKSGAYIINDIVYLINRLQATKQTLLEVRWVPAYTGILGNKIADIAAKEAAGWRAYKQTCTGNRAALPAQVYPLRTTLKT